MSDTRVVLISDEPSDDDLFGGAHRNVAKAIARSIRTDSTGRSVSLVGEWGVGKSTVVRLVREMLRADPSAEHAVVTFDAWTHQGDPLRRSFLESLLGELTTLGWVSPEDWSERASELAGKISLSTITTTPRLTIAGKWLAVAAGITPVGFVALNVVLGHKIDRVRLAAALAASLAIYIVAGVLWTLRRFTSDEARRQNLDPLSPLSSSHVRTEDVRSVESGDPTSVEFEHFFDELLTDALTDPRRRLTIVFDNLDRVEAEDARTIVATMQTFRRASNRVWSNQLWTLVPLDHTGLGRALENGIGSARANEFLDKLFDVSYYVPPLLVSDWSQYLRDILGVAFPDAPSEDVDAAHGVFTAWALDSQGRRDLDPYLTPRFLKRFVNHVGAAVASNPSLSFAAAAAFVLFRRTVGRGPKDLVTSTPLAPSVVALLGPDWRDQLAGAYFGTDSKTGIQLLLEAPLASALQDHDLKRLAELSTVPGFFEVLSFCPYDNWADNGGVTLAQVVASLDESGLLRNDRSARVRERVANVARTMPSWTFSNDRAGRGFAIIADLAVNRGFLTLEESMAKIKVGDEGSNPADAESALEAFIDRVESRPTGTDGTLVHRGSPTDFVRSCAKLGTKRATSWAWPLYRSASSIDEISATVTGLGSAPPNDWSLTSALPVLFTISNRLDVAQVAASFAAVAGGDVTNQVILRQALEVLDFIRDELPEAAAASLEQLQESGQLLNALAVAGATADWPNVALAMVLYLGGCPAVPIPPVERLSAEGHQLVTAILQTPETYPDVVSFQAAWYGARGLGELHTVLDQQPLSRPWASAVLNIVMSDSPGAVSNGDLIDRWLRYEDLLGSHFKPIVRDRLLANDLGASAFRQHLEWWLDVASVVCDVLDETTEDDRSTHAVRDQFADWARAHLRSLSANEWQEAVFDPGLRAVNLLVWLEARGVRIDIGQPLETALREHARRSIGGETVPTVDPANWRHAIESLRDDASREALAAEIVAALADRRGKAPPVFWELYGDYLAEEPTALAHRRMSVEIVEPLLQEPDVSGLTWLTRAARGDSGFLGDAERRARLRWIIGETKAREGVGVDLVTALDEIEALLEVAE